MPNWQKIDGRVPFYDARTAGKNVDDLRHDWHGPDDYLEHAIGRKSPDLVLEFLQTAAGFDVVSAMEMHHARHGAIAWRHCLDVECNRLGLTCAHLAALETLRLHPAAAT
jgi:hypothetical protein